MTNNSDIAAKQSPNWVWRGISLLLAASVVGFMLGQVEWSAFRDVLSRLSPVSMIAAFAVYVLLNYFRAWRYITLLDRPLPVMRVFPISLYHNFLVRLLPFKLGEFAYIVLMQRRLDIPIEEGVSSLFGSRLLELLMIVLVAAVSLLLSGSMFANQSGIVFLLVAFCVIGGIIGFYAMGSILRFGVRLLRGWGGVPFVLKIADRLKKLSLEFDRLRTPTIFGRALAWSILTYSSSFAVNAILLAAIGIQPSTTTLVILVSLGMFATAFPFNISGFGAVELSWALGLTTLMGLSTGEATSIGLMLNGFQLICAAISGGIGYWVVQLQNDTP